MSLLSPKNYAVTWQVYENEQILSESELYWKPIQNILSLNINSDNFILPFTVSTGTYRLVVLSLEYIYSASSRTTY